MQNGVKLRMNSSVNIKMLNESLNSTSTSIQILGRIHMSGRLAKVENLAHVRCNVQCAQVLIYRMSIIVRVKIQFI